MALDPEGFGRELNAVRDAAAGVAVVRDENHHSRVAKLVAKVRELSAAERDLRTMQNQPEMSIEDERRFARSTLQQALTDMSSTLVSEGTALLSKDEQDDLIQSALAALFGTGEIELLLGDPEIYEVILNGAGQRPGEGTFVRTMRGTKELVPPVFASNEALIEWVVTQATYNTGGASRRWDSANPIIEMQLSSATEPLADGARVVGVMDAGPFPVVSIRLHRKREVTLRDLVELNDFSPAASALIAAAVGARMNVIVSGRTGSGKTTLARACVREIPPQERLIVVEHFRELAPDVSEHPDMVPFQERLANAEGQGALTIHHLVEVTKRLNPDRIIVGECMGPEVVTFLTAATQGNAGGITTIHARSGDVVPDRIVRYALEAGLSRETAIALLAEGVDFIIHFELDEDADGREHRWVSQILEVAGSDGDKVLLNTVFESDEWGAVAQPAAPVTDRRMRHLQRFGFAPTSDPRLGSGGDLL